MLINTSKTESDASFLQWHERRSIGMIYTTVHTHMLQQLCGGLMFTVADLCVYNQFDLLPAFGMAVTCTQALHIKENIT